MATGTQRQIQSDKDNWETPEWLWKGIDDHLDGVIDLDPCAGEETLIGVENYRNDTVDGLDWPWYGNVFVNPPFSQKEEWVGKVVTEAQRDEVNSIFLVTPASPTVKGWFHGDRGHDGIVDAVDYIWFPSGRVKYIDPQTGEQAGSPAGGSMVSMFADSPREIRSESVSHETDEFGAIPDEVIAWMNDEGFVVEGVSV